MAMSPELRAKKDAARESTLDAFTLPLLGIGEVTPKIEIKVCYVDKKLNYEVIRLLDYEVGEPMFMELTDFNYEFLYDHPRRLFYYPGWQASRPGEQPPFDASPAGDRISYIIPFSRLQSVEFPEVEIRQEDTLNEFDDMSLSACTVRDLLGILHGKPELCPTPIVRSIVSRFQK